MVSSMELREQFSFELREVLAEMDSISSELDSCDFSEVSGDISLYIAERTARYNSLRTIKRNLYAAIENLPARGESRWQDNEADYDEDAEF